MRPFLVVALTILSIGLLGCTSPGRVIPPVIYPDDDQAAAAMRSAPLIVMAKIADLKLTGDVKSVQWPQDAGDPTAPTFPLHLARINAEVLLTVQGQARTNLEFYSWIWASGKHGGPRLFHPTPGGIRVLFLRNERGYLHTVGDYPSYDLEFHAEWVPALLSGWKSAQESVTDPLERLIALRLRAELEGLSNRQLREDFGDHGPRGNHYWILGMGDLIRVAGPFFVVSQLDDTCHNSPNRSARIAACFVTYQRFPGRCEAFRLAQKAVFEDFGGKLLPRQACEAKTQELISDIRSGTPPMTFLGWSLAPQHRRETMRVYASASDPGVRHAACEATAKTPEARDIPECATRRVP